MTSEREDSQGTGAEYSFEPFRRALGSDYLADDPDLRAILRHHGLVDEAKWKRLESFGKFAASSAREVADATDRPDQLPQT